VLGEPALKMLRYQQQYGFFDLSMLNTSDGKTLLIQHVDEEIRLSGRWQDEPHRRCSVFRYA